MILYMTWFSERGRELAARITELSLSVSYGFSEDNIYNEYYRRAEPPVQADYEEQAVIHE